MALRPKDWGAIPSPQEVAEQMNAISKLEDTLGLSSNELDRVKREHNRIADMLMTARNELGRMLKASNHLAGSEFRVVHIDEARSGNVESHMFGLHRIEG